MEKQAGPNDYPQMLFMLRKRPFTDAELKKFPRIGRRQIQSSCRAEPRRR
jgi:hypothetical protein